MKIFLFLFLIITFSANAQNWALVWEDNFNYTGVPDPAKWSFATGGDGFGNNELQYYTNREKNARVESGNLVIESHKETFQNREYTSAKLITQNKADWKYGKLEVRAKLPSGRGTWPAIWLLPTESKYGNWPLSGEIDLMEYVGFDPGKVHFNIHTEAYNHRLGTNKGASANLINPETNFYTYVLEWYPDSLVFKVEDKKVFTYRRIDNDYKKWPFNEHFYLILNTAIGGDWGGSQGIDNSIFPQKFEVDFVKFYKLQKSAGPFTVTTESIGEGQVKVSPQAPSYNDSTKVVLTAVGNPGYRFLRWKGDIIGNTNPLELILRTDITLQAQFVDENEKILNGNFTNNLENWYLNLGNLNNTVITSGEKVCLQINSPLVNPWDISLTQTDVSLIKGKSYKLKFTASSDFTRTIRVGVGMNKDPWATYVYPTVPLTSKDEIHEIDFVMNRESDAAARVIFDVGGQSGKVCIDDVSLREITVAGVSTSRESCDGVTSLSMLFEECYKGAIKAVKAYTTDGRKIGEYSGDSAEKIHSEFAGKGIVLLYIELSNGETIVRKIY